MTNIQVATWLMVTLFIEIGAVLAIFLMALDSDKYNQTRIVKIALLMMAFGLIVQVIRSIHYFNFGTYPVDRYVPLWIFKDLGASLLIYSYFFKKT